MYSEMLPVGGFALERLGEYLLKVYAILILLFQRLDLIQQIKTVR